MVRNILLYEGFTDAMIYVDRMRLIWHIKPDRDESLLCYSFNMFCFVLLYYILCVFILICHIILLFLCDLHEVYHSLLLKIIKTGEFSRANEIRKLIYEDRVKYNSELCNVFLQLYSHTNDAENIAGTLRKMEQSGIDYNIQ